ncbi:carnitine 3-dehydrogenase [Mesorhizobium loti]|uniref:Carnitine 3-dehydrogenase n=1 Tax=Rhizobium loti TaxID=381 RepID=A0A8E3B2S3_RHILI|nr:carnitine 3-dehydrogenase [Mesorhizobium loti]PWJ88200.1 carnitine 3-dehydrogenase [Mesorhizobium loti]
MKVAIIGCGVIGAGWAARFLLNGHDVSIFDTGPDAERRMREVLANARSSLPALYDRPLPSAGQLDFVGTIAEAVTDAYWVQESVPERLEVKRAIYAAIEPHLANGALLASSTSAIRPSKLQELCSHPERLIVAHPFNPVYLLPLVEVVGSELTPPALKARAAETLQSIGMHPLVLDRENDGFIGNRLQEAMWRETLWMIKEGVATTAQIDEAILYGFGLRCAQMGQFETYRLAGGEAGMRHFFAQFGPSLVEPLSHLMDVPDLDAALIDRIAEQSDAQSAGRSIRETERARDASLVAMIRSLKPQGVGAGGTIRAHEAHLPLRQDGSLPVTARRVIPSSWTDANGHMNEAHYLEIASNAADALTEGCGVTAEYIAAGRSHFTGETHVRYLAELHEGDEITVRTQVLYGMGKKTHLFHRLYGPSEELAATVEMMILHVDLATRAIREPLPNVAVALKNLEKAHAHLPRPDGAGAAIRDLYKMEAEHSVSRAV